MLLALGQQRLRGYDQRVLDLIIEEMEKDLPSIFPNPMLLREAAVAIGSYLGPRWDGLRQVVDARNSAKLDALAEESSRGFDIPYTLRRKELLHFPRGGENIKFRIAFTAHLVNREVLLKVGEDQYRLNSTCSPIDI
jgi:hypothetical protein